MMVRIIFFNNQGEKEWEFVNKDLKGDINRITWSSIIEDEIFIKNVVRYNVIPIGTKTTIPVIK